MTLLLTCVTPRFVVQASDRRLTYTNGTVREDIANKATMLCNFATFAYTGLAQSSIAERTDELMLRALAEPNTPINILLGHLAREATRGIRNLPLPGTTQQRRVFRRTSFVGAGFLGLRTPQLPGKPPSAGDLHPFLAVVSNAQDLREEWRPVADQQFSVHLAMLHEDQALLLHAAGQPLPQTQRVLLERDLRRCLDRVSHPESVARLLARAVRTVSTGNNLVGPNVMCTMIRRDRALDNRIVVGGLVPLLPEVQAEANYFKRGVGGPSGPANWIYSPADASALVHYGPNYACNSLRIAGMIFGPDGSFTPPLPPPIGP